MTLLAGDAAGLCPTRDSTPATVRGQVVGLLNRRLADAIDLQARCKQAHRNVKGPRFVGLHRLFDEVHEAVAEYVDLIAERIVQLGGIADGTVRVAADRSELDGYARPMSDGEQHIQGLSAALAAFGSRMRSAVREMDALNDIGSADLCTQLSRDIDTWRWFVEAHLRAD